MIPGKFICRALSAIALGDQTTDTIESLMDATPSHPETSDSQAQSQPQQPPPQQSQQPVTPYNGATPAATAGGNHNGMVSELSLISDLLFILPPFDALIAIRDPPISIRSSGARKKSYRSLPPVSRVVLSPPARTTPRRAVQLQSCCMPLSLISRRPPHGANFFLLAFLIRIAIVFIDSTRSTCASQSQLLDTQRCHDGF